MNTLTKEKILRAATKAKGAITTKDIVDSFAVSRQYANSLIGDLVAEQKLLKHGSTKKSFYILPKYGAKYRKLLPIRYAKVFVNARLEEHKILDEIEKKIPSFAQLPENVRSIFSYAFSEILNNAIEHSQSKKINIEVLLHDNILSFTIDDFGIGVFNSVQQKKHLRTALEAIQDILKGKTTTMPRSHSGEGIFFTARASDHFILDSYGYQLIFNNELPDVFVKEMKKIKNGTRVFFKVSIKTKLHLLDVFNKYANIDDESDYGFDKTEILVKLYTVGGIHVSRSQARRILAGLEKFRVVLFDYDKVSMVGQAFADEIYRVFHNKHPQIKIEEINMNEAVKFMIERAKTEAMKQQ